MKPSEHASAQSGDHGDLRNQWSGASGPVPAGQIFVIASRYHAQACDSMVAAAVETLRHAGVDETSIQIVRVPGAWELPLAVQAVLQQRRAVGAVAIGVVIRGETTHDEHINRAVSLELMRLGTEFGKPVGLGLLTCNTEDQVVARTGGQLGNKGTEAAKAVLEMLRLTQLIVHHGTAAG
jgi:6,7-dimethyl-8-ribityllumazine synthase